MGKRRANAPNFKIAFREHGEGDVVILLHGYAGRVSHWDSIVPALSKQFHVVIPNLGHLYMGSHPLTFRQQVNVLGKFIEEHFPNKKVYLVGMSYGGALTWGLTLKFPKTVSGVVFINPMPIDPLIHFKAKILKYILRWLDNKYLLAAILYNPVGKLILKKVTHIFREERADHWERIDDLHGKKLLFVAHIMSRFSWILKNEDWGYWRDQLLNWQHEGLCLVDDSDPLFSVEGQKIFFGNMNMKFHILKGAGHIATHSQGPLIARAISSYFRKNKLKKAA